MWVRLALLCWASLIVGCDGGGQSGTNEGESHSYLDPFDTGRSTFLSDGDFTLRRGLDAEFDLDATAAMAAYLEYGIYAEEADSWSAYYYDDKGRRSQVEHYQKPDEELFISEWLRFDSYGYSRNDASIYTYAVTRDDTPFRFDSSESATFDFAMMFTDFINGLPHGAEFGEGDWQGGRLVLDAERSSRTELVYDADGFLIESVNAQGDVIATVIRDTLGRIDSSANGNAVHQYHYTVEGGLEALEVTDLAEAVDQIVRFYYLQEGDEYYLIAESELAGDRGYRTVVALLENTPCHPSQIMEARYRSPELMDCFDRNSWRQASD